MKLFVKLRLYILWLTVVSCIYLTCCPLLFKNKTFVILVNHIPYVLLVIVDCVIIWYKRRDLFSVIKAYISKNKLLFFSIILFVLYDIITIIYAETPTYSIMKYLVFTKSLFLATSIFLCIYDKDRIRFLDNFKVFIRLIGWILVLILTTTTIEWALGISPYVRRISLIRDYNVYANYLMFVLLVFAYYHLDEKERESGKKKIVYGLIGVIGFSFVHLSGSRRAVVLAIPMLLIYMVSYIIKEKASKDGTVLGKWVKKRKKNYVSFLILIAVLILSMQYSAKIFETVLNFDMSSIFTDDSMSTLTDDSMSTLTDDGAATLAEKKNADHETPITSRYDTINMDQGLSNRETIWNVALSEIKKYDTIELIVGKGNGYGWNVYEDINNEGVKDLLAENNLLQIKTKWMYPHSIFLKEFLEGGLIKIILLLFLAIAIIIALFKIIKQYCMYGMMLLSMYICFAGNFVLGGVNGLLGEDLFWLSTAILITLNTIKQSFTDTKRILE